MAKYIDVENLQFEPDPFGGMNGVICLGRSGGKTMATVQAALKRMIDNAPTVDAVEVVRCRDCEFCKYNSSSEAYKCMSLNGMYGTVEPDGFCSYGVRKGVDDE